jgi:hypothetical protein
MKSYANSWMDLNPEYTYRLFDDNDITQFLKSDFPEYFKGYEKLKYGASKADLWRYLIIYKYGGVYADMDCKCIRPLREWVNPEAAFVTQLGINKDLCQWLIISEPRNSIFLNAARKTLENSIASNTVTTHYGFKYLGEMLVIRDDEDLLKFDHPVLGISGPPVLQASAEKCVRDGSISEILSNTQVVCVSGPKSSCQMNGNVIHDTRNLEYKKSLKKVRVIHYNTRLEKIKRKIFSLWQSRKK